MRRKAIISALTIMAVVFMALSTIPIATSDSSGARQPVNIAPLAKASSSGGGSGSFYGPQNMNDLLTYRAHWIRTYGSGGPPYYAQLTWSTSYSIEKMYIIQHGYLSNPSNRNLADCDIQYWTSSGWVTDGSLKGLNSNFGYTFSSVVTTDRIRMVITRCTGSQSSNPCVYEWYVYEGEGGISADVRVEPQSLNLDSMGNYVGVKVEGFPDDPDYSPMDVDGTSVKVAGVGVDLKYGTWNNNRWIGKADRLLVEDAIGAPGDEVEVKINGKLNDGTGFMGDAIIKAT